MPQALCQGSPVMQMKGPVSCAWSAAPFGGLDKAPQGAAPRACWTCWNMFQSAALGELPHSEDVVDKAPQGEEHGQPDEGQGGRWAPPPQLRSPFCTAQLMSADARSGGTGTVSASAASCRPLLLRIGAGIQAQWLEMGGRSASLSSRPAPVTALQIYRVRAAQVGAKLQPLHRR